MFSELQQLEGAGRDNETEDDGEVSLQVIKQKLDMVFLKFKFKLIETSIYGLLF